MRCSTSFCALPMVNLGQVEEEWYQGIVQVCDMASACFPPATCVVVPETEACCVVAEAALECKPCRGHCGT